MQYFAEYSPLTSFQGDLLEPSAFLSWSCSVLSLLQCCSSLLLPTQTGAILKLCSPFHFKSTLGLEEMDIATSFYTLWIWIWLVDCAYIMSWICSKFFTECEFMWRWLYFCCLKTGFYSLLGPCFFKFPYFCLHFLFSFQIPPPTSVHWSHASKLSLRSVYLSAVQQPPATMLITPPHLFSSLLFSSVTLSDMAAFAASILLGSAVAVEMRGWWVSRARGIALVHSSTTNGFLARFDWHRLEVSG